MALFFFLLAKETTTFLPTALSAALRPPFPIQKAQYAPAFLLKRESFCQLSACLGSTDKSAIFFSSSFSKTFAVFLLHHADFHLFSYLTLSSASGRNYHFFYPPSRSDYNGSPVIHFSGQRNELAGEVCYSGHLHFRVVFLLSDQRPTNSSKFFDAQNHLHYLLNNLYKLLLLLLAIHC